MSRFHIGLVIASGLGIGTVFSLFVVPAVYLLLAREHKTVPNKQSEAASANQQVITHQPSALPE